ncbi:CBS domain-containing protein [Methanobacterium formicicum]|nr:CBS domain-containing protein [Methanobacterium formicicum]
MSPVEEVMTPDPVTVAVDAPATSVRSIFREEGFRTIPVISDNRLEGIITRPDMLQISSTKSNLDARSIMQQPRVIATPDMELIHLAREIMKAETVYAPVVESTASMQLVGIVTVADILRKFLYNGIKPVHETLGEMKFSPAITCNYDDLLSHVWKRMDESGYSGLPVMKKEKLIGIITRMDIIRSGHVRVGFDSNTRDAILVEKVMKTPPVVATPQTPVREAGEIILEYDIGRIPVVENPVYVKREPRRAKEADLVGIVSREDILWSYLN